jgi:transposase
VQLWRQRFLSLRLAGLEKDAPRPGSLPRIPQKKVNAVVEATLHTTPANATHWSTRSMAKAQGISEATVRRIWKQHNLKPHLVETFKLSRDKHFIEKLCDVVGLYVNPPDKAIVFCVDEKSQIQALDRTQPLLPLRPGIPARQTHDYKRNGTTTLFAALSMLDGTVIGDCMPRHRHQEFIRFMQLINVKTPANMELHLIVDNYGTHKHPRVQSWLRRHPRFRLHFTPTSSSWLNLVERWFREITDKRIRRGSFKNVQMLVTAIQQYIDAHNQNPRVFIWSASAESILAKIAKCKEALDAPH